MVALIDGSIRENVSSLEEARDICLSLERGDHDMQREPHSIEYNEDGSLNVGGERLPMTETAFKQLLSKTHIPATFAERIPDDLLKANVDYLKDEVSSNWVMRTRTNDDGQRYIRALVTDRYRPLKDSDFLQKAIEEFDKRDQKIDTWNITIHDDMMRATGIFDIEFAPSRNVGDITRSGLELLNGTNGLLPFAINTFLWRLACSNGLIVPESVGGSKKRHIGDDFNVVYNKGFDAAFNSLEVVKNLWSKSADTLITTANTSTINKIRDIVKSMIGTKDTRQIFDEDAKGKTIYDLLNMLTARARDMDSPIRQRSLEATAGRLLLAA